MEFTKKRNLLASPARVQVPWIKVVIGSYTFGIFTQTKKADKDDKGFYTAYNVQYPNYIQSLNIKKINGQVNQYTLTIIYPIRAEDDPNFFEKVFSSVSSTRKIIFSYGDMSMPTYIYKDEEALITSVGETFNLTNSSITYTVSAISTAAMSIASNYTYMGGHVKPSEEIMNIFQNSKLGLQNTFTGMSIKNLSQFIEGGDKEVDTVAKVNTSALEVINYLVSCMVPEDSVKSKVGQDMYILTMHDDTSYDRTYNDALIVDGREVVGPYFKVTRTSTTMEHPDAYELDIGYNTSTLVLSFSLQQQNNYSILFDYQDNLNPESYVRRINSSGVWEDVYAPAVTSKNVQSETFAENTIWWTKMTQYPINAIVVVQGLLRPAQLMTYVRLNILFPGGNKHVSSGLYIITAQNDQVDQNGYRTTLNLTRIGS